MNPLLKNVIAVQGLDKAMKVAQALIEADYQVMIQLEDCNVYIVSYNPNDLDLGDELFVSLPQEKVEEILEEAEDKWEEKSEDNEEESENQYGVDSKIHTVSLGDSSIEEVLKKLHPDDIKLNCKGKFTNNYDDIPKVEK